jgi:hypothetical protein
MSDLYLRGGHLQPRAVVNDLLLGNWSHPEAADGPDLYRKYR